VIVQEPRIKRNVFRSSYPVLVA